MADFFLTTSTNVAQTMGLADSGVVAQGVTLFSGGSTSAVTMNGAARLTALGSVVSENAVTLSIASTAVSATVNVGQTGSMISMLNAAIFGTITSQFFLNNSGVIQGFTNAIRIATPGTGTVVECYLVNSGTIQSNGNNPADATIEFALLTGGRIDLANSGTILNGGRGMAIEIQVGSAKISNSGLIAVTDGFAIATGSGLDRLINLGRIGGDVFLGSGADRLVNHGLIEGGIDLGDGEDVFISKGGRVMEDVLGGPGNNTFIIDDGSISLSGEDGYDTVISSDHYSMGRGIDELELSGLKGLMGVGNSLANFIRGTVGNDTLLGEEGNDTVISGKGDDVLSGGSGNDLLILNGDNGVARGGSGNDTIDLESGNATISGGSGSDILNLEIAEPGDVNLATGTGRVGLDQLLTLRGIESVVGGNFNDTLNGSAEGNSLRGRLGNDVLRGQAGDDVLQGDQGSDTMTGGTGTDKFIFLSVTDSAIGFEDLITDFNVTQDLIDLSAVQVAPGDDGPFSFVGTAPFNEGKAEVRFFTDAVAGQTVIEIRREGSLADDMQIILSGIKALTADHFVL